MNRCLRRSTILATACAVALGAFAPSVLSQEASGELVLYYGMGRSGVQPVIDAFEEATGITVNALRQPTEELMSTIELEMRAGQPRADVIFISEAQLKALDDAHAALRPYEPAGFEYVPDNLKDPEGKRIPAIAAMYVIQYNTNHVAPEEAPTSFADLLDDRWVNQIAIADPQSSSSVHAFIWLVTQVYGSKGEPYGWHYFDRLGEMNLHLTGGHGGIRDMVVSGERPVGVQVAGTANVSVLAGEPTAFSWPEEGTSAEILTLGLLEASANMENAERFVDFVLSPEGQMLLGENTGHAPVRSDAAFSYVDGKNIGNLDIDIHAVDVDHIAQNRMATMRRFQQAMGRR